MSSARSWALTMLLSVATVWLVGCGADDATFCPTGTERMRRAADDPTSGGLQATWCERSDGTVHGPYNERDVGGAVRVEGRFDEGLPAGEWRRMDGEGGVTVERFVRGVAHGEWSEHDHDDQLRWRHFFAWGQPCGQWQDLVAGAVVTTAFPACDGFSEPDDLPTAAQRAPAGGPGWDGGACPKGSDTAVAASDPIDAATRFCSRDGKRDGPFGAWYPQHTDGTSWQPLFPVPAASALTPARRSAGQYLAGARSGMWRFFHSTGAVARVGAFTDDLPSGVWRAYSPAGAVVESGAYVDGKRSGEWIARWPDGKIRAKTPYNQGLRDGLSETFFANSQPESSTIYVAHVAQGAFQLGWPNGHVKAKGSYVDGLRSGAFEAFWPNGKPSEAGVWLHGGKQGEWRTWHSDTTEDTIGSYVNGVRHGTWTVHHYDTLPSWRETGSMVAGHPDGTWQQWWATGAARGFETWQNGALTGPTEVRWPNGNKLFSGAYLQGDRHGEWRFWHEDGKAWIVTGYRYGLLHGPYKRYFANGQLELDGAHFLDRRDGPWKAWYDDGKPRYAGTYERGGKKGKWMYWDTEGVPKALTHGEGSQGGGNGG